MIGLEDRRQLARDIDEARKAGARLKAACEVMGVDARTVQRWKAGDGLIIGDGRPGALRPTPPHALSVAEREQLLRVANEQRFADVPPARIVPALADEGVYLASESSFCQWESKFPQVWELKIPHPVHASASSGRTRPAFNFSFNRYELPRMFRVTA